ncbi:hypothetical protein BC628DRAFT_434595 [Trametes gibbosa]|nr:hypothetical protein BC628DRAFT_434595 [Trametes gibbosa]
MMRSMVSPSDDPSQVNHEYGALPEDAFRRHISLRLSQLEEQISGLQREQQALRAQWNTRLAVCRLPPEIIVDIFTQYCACCYTRHRRTYAQGAWVNLRLVSRYWNAVACATPVLWREIDAYRHSSWLTLCLERSQRANLDIAFHNYTFPAADMVAMLLPHAHRVRELLVNFPLPTTWAMGIAQLCRCVLNMPVMEVMRISNSAQPKDAYIDLNLTHSLYPCLHTLNLYRASLPFDMQLLSKLRILHVDACMLPSDFTVDRWMSVLASNRRLEDLKISYFLDQLVGNWATLAELRRPPINLHRLTRIEVSGHSPSLSAVFLTHLLIPADAHVIINGDLGDVAEEDVTETLSALLPPPAVRNDSLPVLQCSIRRVALDVLFTDYELSAFTSVSAGLPSLFLSISSSDVDEWEDSLDRGILDLVHLFSGSPLTDLQVSGICDNVDQEHWEVIFNTFPDLEKITLRGEGSISAFWTALSSVPNDRHDLAPPSPPCPRLKHITCRGYFEDVAILFATMYHSLMHRAECGSRLESLCVEAFSSNTPDYQEMTDTYASQLHGIVNVVVFSDLRSGMSSLLTVKRVPQHI